MIQSNIQAKRNTLYRTLLLCACTAGLAAAPMLAQDTAPAPQAQQQPPQGGWQGRGGDGQQRQLDRLTAALSLTPDQVSKVKAFQVITRQQMEAVRSDSATEPDGKRAKAMTIRQTEQTNIRSILTDDQKTKFDAMQAEMRQRREQHPQGDQAPPPPPPSN